MSTITLYFDYVDPASYVMETRARLVARELGLSVRVLPFEIRPPDAPPLSDDDAWITWWDRVRPLASDLGLQLTRPERVPLTRKAHQLALLAEERGDGAAVREALYRACLARNVDVARVDHLVPIAERAGLDRGETLAVLDVDRLSSDVDRIRAEAEAREVRGVPTLLLGEHRMEGVHDVDAIREFVSGESPPDE